MPYDSISQGALDNVAWQVSLAKSQNAVKFKKRGFTVRWMTWQAISARLYLRRLVRADEAQRQGLTQLPFPARLTAPHETL